MLEKLPSMEDLGQTDRVTTPSRAGIRRCRCRAACLAALWQLMTSQRKPTITAISQYSVDPRLAHIFALTFDLDS